MFGSVFVWWQHQMETFSALLALCAGNSPVTGEFPSQRQVTRSFDVFFHLRLNKRLSKQSWGWWFETSSRSLWRHDNGEMATCIYRYEWQQVTILAHDEAASNGTLGCIWLTHCCLGTSYGVVDVGQHCFRHRSVACPFPGHHLNQFWLGLSKYYERKT